ncbi:DUF4157 domain-containing protein [Paludibacterium purpuratum]|nr:DUF4157 domain-containing protein [Paludibacterium purpuratum]
MQLGAPSHANGLPAQLRQGIESLSGFDMSDVRVHRNSDKPAQLQAHAYAQGGDIYLGSGQDQHLPHEAWHVVQQRQGRVRPTLQMKTGVAVNDDAGLEREADAMGESAMRLAHSPGDLSPILQRRMDRTAPVVQRASALVLIGSVKDMNDLKVNTKLEEENLGLKSVKLANANLGTIGADDTLYLSGAHGDSDSYGPYGSGVALVNALWARGLRVCRSIWLTGCETGNGFSADFYAKATQKGIDIKEYVTAPKTYGRTRNGGRMTAETPEGVQVRKLKEEKGKLDFLEQVFGKGDELQKQIDDIVNKPGYWEEIENPIQLAEEVKEMYDDLDRYYAGYDVKDSLQGDGFDYDTYEKQFKNIKDTYNPRLKKAIEVWATHGKESVKEAFLAVYNRQPVARKVWDLSGLF